RRHRLAHWLCRDRRPHCRRIHRQRCCVARHRPRTVAHHHIERRPIISTRRRWRHVARRCRPRNVRSVLLPLVAQRRRACRHHRERRRLPRRHRLAHRLCRDRLPHCRRIHRQRCRVARHRPRTVAHHHIERRPIISTRRRWRHVARRCRPRNVRSVLLPLVAQRRRACRHHRERRRLPRRHRLAHRLCRDRLPHCRRIHRQRCRVARHRPRTVAHHHIERRPIISTRRRWRHVARRCRPRNVRPVLLPLVAQRRRACRHHRERRRLPRRHRLAHRLCRDRRPHCRRIHRQRCCVARHRPHTVAHHHIERRPIVRTRRRWRHVARRCRPRNVRPVLLPLVAQRRRACRHHRERRRLPRRHRLAHWLCRDRRPHCRRIHRQRCCVARHRPRTVAHHHIERRPIVRTRRRWRHVARRCRPRNVRPVLLPLVAQRRRACRHHRERRRLPRRHRLAHWLCCDRRPT